MNHYINSPDGLVMVNQIKLDEKGGLLEENDYYILKDHLGSIDVVMKENSIEKEFSYDAWGRPRNPKNWEYDNVEKNSIFDRGYTGHEHLEEFNLINMNGRLYDPILGRFLSPDPAPVLSLSNGCKHLIGVITSTVIPIV